MMLPAAQALWGDYGYQPKTKRIIKLKGKSEERIKLLFVQLALEPIWKAYTAVERGADYKVRHRGRLGSGF
jgi:ribosome assembly protein 1